MEKFFEMSPDITYMVDITVKIADENSEKYPLDSDVKIAFKITVVIPTQRKVSQCIFIGIPHLLQKIFVLSCIFESCSKPHFGYDAIHARDANAYLLEIQSEPRPVTRSIDNRCEATTKTRSHIIENVFFSAKIPLSPFFAGGEGTVTK